MKKSTILFIIANLVVMSAPFWTTLPLNKLIAAGKIRSKSKEDEAKLMRTNFGEITALEVKADSGRINLHVDFSDHNQMTMDTSYKNFVKMEMVDKVLKIYFDHVKYAAWIQKSYIHDKDYRPEESYAVVAEERSSPEITLQLNLKKISFVNATNAEININTSATYPLNNPFEAVLDTSDLTVDYYEIESDSTEEARVYADLKYPVTIIEKNGSETKFTFLKNIDLSLRLINDFFSISSNLTYEFKNIDINYDNQSDVNLNISDLHKIGLHKVK